MSYVIYNVETTKIVLPRDGNNYSPSYQTLGAAKAALTRYNRRREKHKLCDRPSCVCRMVKDLGKLEIAESEHFHKSIEKTEVRHGIVHSEGKEFVVPVNTPWTSGPWSETYWSS